MPVSEKAKRMRAAVDQAFLADNPHYAQALRELMGPKSGAADMFPSTQPGQRGAVSPLGGVAKPASEGER
jgi:hypothetical protein